jgi:hypothetical protein
MRRAVFVVLSAAKDLHFFSAVIPLLLLLTLALPAGAQDPKKPKAAKPPKTPNAAPAPIPPLFTSETPLAVTFTANFGKLNSDKGETSPYRYATMSYTGADGKTVTVPMKAKTHGVWRLRHCVLPPIRLNINNKESKQTLFYDLQKPKMVSVCKNQDAYEQLVLKEMQLYRIYQTITPMSHRVRTLRVTYTDSASGKIEATRYAFLFEDPDELADRLGGTMTKVKGATADDMDADPLALAYMFEYFIGNLDFSFNGLHNGEVVLKRDGTLAIPVAYDFDFSGAVNAPYATVDPQFRSKRVVERVFRGYCAIQGAYPAAIAVFQQKKDAIYALYHDDVGKLLAPGIAKESLEYFDDFYDQVKTPKDAEVVTRNCVGPR